MTILLKHKVDSGDNVKKALCLLDVDRPPSSFIRVNPHSSPSALPHREKHDNTNTQKNEQKHKEKKPHPQSLIKSYPHK